MKWIYLNLCILFTPYFLFANIGDVKFDKEHNIIPAIVFHPNCITYLTRTSKDPSVLTRTELILLTALAEKGYQVLSSNGEYNTVYGFNADDVYGVFDRKELLAWLGSQQFTDSNGFGSIRYNFAIKSDLFKYESTISAYLENVKVDDEEHLVSAAIAQVIPKCEKTAIRSSFKD